MADHQGTGRAYRVEVTLDEDMHSGTGMGRGSGVDAVQARDRRGSPVIRETHFKGLLKDALRRYGSEARAQVLFEREKTGQGPGVTLTSLYLHPPPCGAESPEMLQWSTTAREPGRRRPQDETLRTLEYVPAGTRFRGRLLLREASLFGDLETAMIRTDCVGSGRTRGSGRVRIALESGWDPADRPEPVRAGADAPDDRHLVWRLLLRNPDPLRLPTTGYPGNLIASESFIRGQVLMGALVGWALRRGRVPKDLEPLLDRRVLVADALPLPEDVQPARDLVGWEAVPAPASLGVPKPAGAATWTHSLPWWTTPVPSDVLGRGGERDRLADSDGEAVKLKKLPEGLLLWRRMTGTPWRLYRPVLGVHLRNGQDPVRTRVDGEPDLFAEEEIAERTLFLSDLRFRTRQDAERIHRIFTALLSEQEWLLVGRSGRPVEVVGSAWMPVRTGGGDSPGAPSASSPESHGNEPSPPARDGGNGTGSGRGCRSLSITLTSDTIIRDPRLRFHEKLTLNALEDALSVQPVARDRKEPPAASSSLEVRGFNAASGLPRVAGQALRRGSVLRVEGGAAAHLRRRLETVERLGERTWEGFGRFRLDFDPLAENRASEGGHVVDEDRRPENSASHEAAPLKPEEDVLARAWALEKSLTAKGSSLSVTQWYALREQAMTCEDLADLKTWIGTQSRRLPDSWRQTEPLLLELLDGVEGLDIARSVIRGVVRIVAAKARRER